MFTADKLAEVGINTFYSRCLTLTFRKDACYYFRQSLRVSALSQKWEFTGVTILAVKLAIFYECVKDMVKSN